MQYFLLAALGVMALYSVIVVLFIVKRGEKLDRVAVPVKVKRP